ncbi:RNA 2',3'-cyclic phosphodiesterase [Pseudomonas donghuensis]|uniref:RNA 2',3'-cyclic phosphodiesterase n=1 Tax=Pseudomonas donghuensis TaxID=1163398 RepID=UPI002E13E07A|nr:RNA 2',3'-cyclic phosphodiesterase [Pseudomonas donghuensis]
MAPGIGETGEPFKRLFFALDCGPEQRRAIARWRGELDMGAARPVPSANFHLTLMFVGAAGTAQLPAILAAAAGVKVPGELLTLVLDRLEVWRPAKALVLVPSQTPAALRQLAYALQQAMLPLGIVQDPRDYRPHLTLARDYRGSEPEALEPAAFMLRARHFTLFESRKGQYWPLAQWPI